MRSPNPHASGLIGMIGCLMIRAGEYDRGIGLINKSIDRNKSYPPTLTFYLSLLSEAKGLFAGLSAGGKMGMPDLILNIILWISILSQMDRKVESEL
jgi:hypothetical protein